MELQELINALKSLTCALGMLAGVLVAILTTFLFCKLIMWLKEYDHKSQMHKKELEKFTQSDKDDLMFYVRQEMRNFKNELKEEDNNGKEKI